MKNALTRIETVSVKLGYILFSLPVYLAGEKFHLSACLTVGTQLNGYQNNSSKLIKSANYYHNILVLIMLSANDTE